MSEPHSLAELETALRRELDLLGYPPAPWVVAPPPAPSPTSQLYDVVIIGAGMAGLAAAFALRKVGIAAIKIYDAAPAGREGPWLTYARMLTLRSWKGLTGPALDVANLSFQAWYTAQHGPDGWEALYKIPNRVWMDYLGWYRRILELPVNNEHTVDSIYPEQDALALDITHQGWTHKIMARKVVLATGRSGFGGCDVPHIMQALPKTLYAHTNEDIDFRALKGKRVGILGVGASAFDAAAVALETGSHSVDLLCRRPHVPQVNKAIQIIYPGFSSGYYKLPDEARWQIFNHLYAEGAPPPFESLDRITRYPNVQVRCNLSISSAHVEGAEIVLSTNQGALVYDFIILGTGFTVDVTRQPMLRTFSDHIQLWQDRPFNKTNAVNHKQVRFPYLGPHFQFLEKKPETASFLKNIYCFNWAATLSHALLSSDIPDISVGAARLAQGIAADFFTQEWPAYDRLLQNFHVLEFEEDKYSFFK